MRVTLDIDGPDVGMLTETEIEDAVYTMWRKRRLYVRGNQVGFDAYVRASIER